MKKGILTVFGTADAHNHQGSLKGKFVRASDIFSAFMVFAYTDLDVDYKLRVVDDQLVKGERVLGLEDVAGNQTVQPASWFSLHHS